MGIWFLVEDAGRWWQVLEPAPLRPQNFRGVFYALLRASNADIICPTKLAPHVTIVFTTSPQDSDPASYPPAIRQLSASWYPRPPPFRHYPAHTSWISREAAGVIAVSGHLASCPAIRTRCLFLFSPPKMQHFLAPVNLASRRRPVTNCQLWMASDLPERVARLALDAFDALPRRCKPRADHAGVREWVPMSAVVLAQNDVSPPALHLAALATGSKCIPATTLPKAHGLILHDSHSEVLALRGLNRFLLQEAHRLLKDPGYQSPFLVHADGQARSSDEPPFRIHPAVTIHLFSTEPPCGDASMEFIMSTQQDATPWPVPPPSASITQPNGDETAVIPGRSYFSALSIVRRKPSRPDAPPTLSKSCTDKLTLKQFTSVLSSLTALLISPRNAYISTFTVSADKYREEGYHRAFSATGRLSTLLSTSETLDIPSDTIGYSFTPLTVTPLPATFNYTYTYSKPPPTDTATKASNISALHINCSHPSARVTEVLISGVKQGNAQLSTDDRKGSSVSRKEIWQLVREIAELLSSDDELKSQLAAQRYANVKAVNIERTAVKQRVVDALAGWHRNRGDDEWGL
ncbi:hypothetical protein Dda_3036 [Drechslerella dactyloides]|uniref:A to I editase domain-containing protein n=1 Tax=Drechslerella dactyloides TaxID=74499 RepID=A0AAD6J505_DREDA|nr:hypothetical protein Dda_3036 [Drechslerella dactyloides]